MTDREACIALNMIPGIGYVKFQALCDYFGSPAAVLQASEAELRQVKGIGGKLALNVAQFPRDLLDRELDWCDRAGVRIITLYDGGYPEVLRNLYDPPLVLYVRGLLPEFPDRAIAMVGSRRMSNYGARMTKSLTAEAVAAGYTVVSGLAYGVDAVAHRTTLENRGITVAVLAGGLLHINPTENIPLAQQIVENNGALISEFPLDFPPQRTSFPRRNRIVAGLCRGTIVTEAGLESGALITARLALENGRDVFAVPGHADNPQAAGCHKLIKEGANLVENFGDVLSAFGAGLLPGFECEVDPAANRLSDLPRELQSLLGELNKGDASLEMLVQATGRPAGDLLGSLMQLELKLMIEETPEHFYHRLV